MSVEITLLLLFAAFTHAVWNGIVKSADDNVAMATWVYGAGGLFLAPALLVLPPLPAVGWALIGVHFALHMIYKVLLVEMYRLGDFSLVFPVARGSAPALITLIAIPAAGELPAPLAATGVGVICLGLVIFTLEPGAIRRAGALPLLLALAAGVVVSVYTVVDALGVRLEGAGLTYFVTLFTVDAIGMILIALLWRKRALWPLMRTCWRLGLSAALLSIVNFGIVLWVMSFNPIGLAAAVRETSIVMAALIGALVFKEGFGPRRVTAAGIILAGIVLINWQG